MQKLIAQLRTYIETRPRLSIFLSKYKALIPLLRHCDPSLGPHPLYSGIEFGGTKSAALWNPNYLQYQKGFFEEDVLPIFAAPSKEPIATPQYHMLDKLAKFSIRRRKRG